MTTYVPDRWVVLRMTGPGREPTDKVLAGWKGGFADPDYWKLNSGNESVEEFDDRYEFKGYSGSVYVCYKCNYGFTSLSQTIYNDFLRQTADRGEGYKIELVNMVINDEDSK